MAFQRNVRNLREDQQSIRNLCILAHVDHGKTTLADTLVASNGVIPPRMAGKMRYMDSREDEQRRGITMKASAIALHFEKDSQRYLINLIDSPGHVDFSSEVSTAVRLCDGALVVVDVLEGVCPQTQVVLQQAYREGIKPCLVLNKMDRLIVERKLTPVEAYVHLQQLLEQVNAIMGSLFTSDVFESSSANRKQQQQQQQQLNNSESVSEAEDSKSKATDGEVAAEVFDWSSGLEDIDDSSVYFFPEQENVVFASAIDGWGFSIGHFADLYAKKLGMKAEILKKTLWGDFYLNSKDKRIYKGAQARGKKPLFVQFILENIWAVYDAVVVNRNTEKIQKITASLKLKVSPRDSNSSDSRSLLFAICNQWLPLANAVLEVAVKKLPSPAGIQEDRVEKLMCEPTKTFDSFPPETQALRKAFMDCSRLSDAPVIAYISKMFPTPRSGLLDSQSSSLSETEVAETRELAKLRAMATTAHEQAVAVRSLTEGTVQVPAGVSTVDNNQGVVFLAFARIFSGTLVKGQQLFLLHPRYDPRENQQDIRLATPSEAEQDPSLLPEHVTVVTIGNLYVLMGRSVEEVDQAGAGHIVGIGGLEGVVLKSATLSSRFACPAFRAMSFAATPIVEVAVEPYHAADLPVLRHGMQLLNQADPCVRITISDKGEYILAAAGEVHLQRCLDDLKSTYAKIRMSVSAPIIPFRETLVLPPKVDMLNETISDTNDIKCVRTRDLGSNTEVIDNRGTVRIVTSNRVCELEILAKPLPERVTSILEINTNLLKILSNLSAVSATSKAGRDSSLNAAARSSLMKLREELQLAFEEAGPRWRGCLDQMWSFGPRHCGPNILVNQCSDYHRPSIWSAMEGTYDPATSLRDFDNSVMNGFQLASQAGPLCEEPLHGVCFFIKKWTMTLDSQTDQPQPAASQPLAYTSVGGQLISTIKDGCRRALLSRPIRLMLAMYKCKILATSEVLGRVYGVVSRRQGRILAEEMKEGSNLFEIDALIPVAESFGFAEDIRKKTSGLASPQLMFSHWEVLKMDPFWVPSTEEELTHFGEKADSGNVAEKYMKAVRKRKGLFTEDKLVEHGEKQRTLKR